MKKLIAFFKKRTILLFFIISLISTIILSAIASILDGTTHFSVGFAVLLVPAFLISFPFVITLFNLIMLFSPIKDKKFLRKGRIIEYITIISGGFLSFIALFGGGIIIFADWNKQLQGTQLHTPIEIKSSLTIIVIALIAALGYIILRFVKLTKLPPLIAVLCIGAMYLGVAECIIWLIQISVDFEYIYFCFFPINCIVIAFKLIKEVVFQWKELCLSTEESQNKYANNAFLSFINKLLYNSFNWPLVALLATIPLLGIIISILLLFGQKPDSIITAFTNTADWRLSEQIAPQNIIVDDHYLCTVAAGGHRKIVKPQRYGVRKGKRIIVNRQLCIANAFEQIIEEKTPRFHKALRNFYDTYGYPFAKNVKSKYIADLIYFIMKPLEWIFLIVIYSSDTEPENRIAMQYIKKPNTK